MINVKPTILIGQDTIASRVCQGPDDDGHSATKTNLVLALHENVDYGSTNGITLNFHIIYSSEEDENILKNIAMRWKTRRKLSSGKATVRNDRTTFWCGESEQTQNIPFSH
ncbi:hypothetical protein JTB14_021671 [Gonioctena quinquepunctata]|nr:hypothetical protein JTB14_021671 [Gonioctena quinquepunctata]